MNAKAVPTSLGWLAAAALGLFAATAPAYADSEAIDFESFAPGSVNGQNGWSETGGCANYDVAVVPNSYGYASFGTQSLRISNAVTSGCFGDQTFAAPLADAAGEHDATTGSFSAGNRHTHYELEFDVASTVPTAQQPNLFISVSPDRGDGSRMSYLGFSDGSAGIDVTFYDVQGTGNPADFVPTTVATGLDRTVPHHVKLTMDLMDGASNDFVQVYIDGTLVHTGTSWENYYRYDGEASAEQSTRIVKTVLFRSAGTAEPANAGNGFLFDNVSLSTSDSVADGSFEDGPGGNYAYIPGSDGSINGWTTTLHGVEWFDPSAQYGWGPAKDGTHVIDLAPQTYTGGGIEQTVDTVPGQLYDLQFYGSTLQSNGRDGTGQIDVMVDGSRLSSFNLTNHTHTVNWHLFHAYFVATAETTTIGFQNTQNPLLHFAFVDAVGLGEAVPGSANLVVDSVTASPSPAAVGEQVTITATVKNIGTSVAENFSIDLYRNPPSYPTVFQTGDFTCNVDSLAPGDTTQCTATTSYATTGVKIIWAQADTLSAVPETDETDNRNDTGLGVMLPDLRVVSLAAPVTDVTTGQAVQVTAVVQNVSGVDVINPFRVDLYQDRSAAPGVGDAGDYVCNQNDVLAPSDTLTCTTLFIYGATGSPQVWAQVDTGNAVTETHEDNNLKGPAIVTVVAPYTLTLSTAGGGSGTVTGGGSYIGGSTATVSAAADAGSVFTGWSGTDAAECATGTVAMTADKSCTATFDLANPADLKIAGITVSPAKPAVGEDTTVTVDVSNAGGDAGAFQVDVYKALSGAPAVGQAGDGSCSFPGLEAGGTIQCVVHVQYATTGVSVLWAQADSQNTVTETNESNNTASTGVAVYLPDLRVVSLTMSPSSRINLGDPVTVTAVVQNVSGVDVYQSFNVDLYSDSSVAPAVGQAGDLMTCTVPSLGPSETYSCQGTVTYATTGAHKAWAQVDTNNDITETREDNNLKSIGATVR